MGGISQHALLASGDRNLATGMAKIAQATYEFVIMRKVFVCTLHAINKVVVKSCFLL